MAFYHKVKIENKSYKPSKNIGEYMCNGVEKDFLEKTQKALTKKK